MPEKHRIRKPKARKMLNKIQLLMANLKLVELLLVVLIYGFLISGESFANEDLSAQKTKIEIANNADNTDNADGKNNQDQDDEIEDFDFEGKAVPTVYDPLEKSNRKVFAFNETVDIYFVQYIAKGYRRFVPTPVRTSVRNFLRNLSMPLNVLNSALQGDGENSLASLSHFLINSTIGVGGLFDVAGRKNIRYRSEDFGQTLAKYGVPPGPYLLLPVLGPSNVRDGSALLTEKLAVVLSFDAAKGNNQNRVEENNLLIAEALIDGLDTRESLIDILDEIRKNSFDSYATIRSAYIQKRDFEVKNNQPLYENEKND